MGSIEYTTDQLATKITLENERRDIRDLWNDALRAYNGIMGEDIKPTFSNVDSMITHGVQQMEAFHKWRHDAKKVDKLRGLFMANIEFIESGAKSLAAAATPVFPPASAIGTALTFVLTACKSVSADYDVVTAFFEDMNSFLQRVSILESRLPAARAYQVCLMDVFTSLLKMCAFASKFIKQGRFKKWIINSVMGQDADLAGSRKDMDKTMKRLESATEFAILANTENLIDGQTEIYRLQGELVKNQALQNELAANQQLMLKTVIHTQVGVQSGIDDIKSDLKDVLMIIRQQQRIEQASSNKQSKIGDGSNHIKAIVSPNEDNELQLQLLRQNRVRGMGVWLLQDPQWQIWERSQENAILHVSAPMGMGKSYLAVAAVDHIQKLAEQDPGNFTIAAYFFCQKSVQSLNDCQSIVNAMALQVSNQSLVIRERFNKEFSKDGDRLAEDMYFQKLIIPAFEKSSKYQLLLIIDGIDELRTDTDYEKLMELLDEIERLGLRIKVMTTSRQDIDKSSQRLHQRSKINIMLTKAMILDDMQRLLMNRLNNTDSAYAGLARLRTHAKQKIAASLQDKASGLLYIEHVLRYLSGIGREGAILRELECLPDDIEGLFALMLKKCERRTPSDLVSSIRSLFAWLTFAFDSLHLNEMNAIVQSESGNEQLLVEDEIDYIYGSFIYIGSAVVYTGLDAPLKPNVEASKAVEDATAVDDGDLQIAFRERSMRDFFCVTKEQNNLSQLRFRATDGHRHIFLACCKVISTSDQLRGFNVKSKGLQNLESYALKNCLRHWFRIDFSRHSSNENAMVYEAFVALISDRHGLANLIEIKAPAITLSDMLEEDKHLSWTEWVQHFLDQWTMWSMWLHGSGQNSEVEALTRCLSSATLNYWSEGSDSALSPLAKAHVENWLDSVDVNGARKAYACARSVLKITCLKTAIIPGMSDLDAFWEDDLLEPEDIYENDFIEFRAKSDDHDNEIFGVRSLFDAELTSRAYFATAVIFASVSRGKPAIEQLKLAMELCNSLEQHIRYQVYMAKVIYMCYQSADDGEMKQEAFKEALQYAEQALANPNIGSLNLKFDCLDVKYQLLHAFGQARAMEVAAFLEQMQSEDPTFAVSGWHIVRRHFKSLLNSSEHCHMVLDIFTSLGLAQSIELVSDGWLLDIRLLFSHRVLLGKAQKVNRLSDLVEPYRQIAKGFDVDGCGSLWRLNLADLYLKLGDIQSAKSELFLGLAEKQENQEFPRELVTFNVIDVGHAALSYVDTISDILYREFRTTKTPERKFAILDEVKGLLLKPLSKSAQINSTEMIPHLIIIARMSKKLGVLQDFQSTLQQLFDICWENLHDSYTTNDSINLALLAKVVAQMPNMRKDAQILSAAQIYDLGEHSLSEVFKILDEKFGGAETIDDSVEDNYVKPWRSYSDMEKFRREHPYRYSTWSYVWRFGIYGDVSIATFQCTAKTLGCRSFWYSLEGWEVDKEHGYGGVPVYTCLCCTKSMLCFVCYEQRMKWNKEGNPDPFEEFCCQDGEYLETPPKGWKGIREGVIEIEGEDPITVDAFLEGVRDRWNKEWENFWLG